MLNLFVINNTDLSNSILEGSYNINEHDESKTWTDGDYIEHRYGGRKRVEGSFSFRFLNVSQFNAFVDLMAAQKQTGDYYIVTLRVNNINTTKTINAFISYDAGLNQRSNLQLDIPEIKINVREC